MTSADFRRRCNELGIAVMLPTLGNPKVGKLVKRFPSGKVVVLGLMAVFILRDNLTMPPRIIREVEDAFGVQF